MSVGTAFQGGVTEQIDLGREVERKAPAERHHGAGREAPIVQRHLVVAGRQVSSETAMSSSILPRARCRRGITQGATGLAQSFELTHQLRGTADRRQVPRARIGLQHNAGLGGAAVVSMFERVDARGID